MNSSKKLEEIKSLLPLYVKQNKMDEKCEQIDKSLDNEEIKRELNFWKMIDRGYENLKCTIPEPNKKVFTEILKRIDKERNKKRGFFNFFILNRRYSVAFMVAQFLVILALIFYILNLKYEYRTLSVSNIKAATKTSLNVVFNENAREIEIRELLRQIDGKIIDGPSSTGLYLIEIKDKEKKDFALRILKESKIVFFVEPAP